LQIRKLLSTSESHSQLYTYTGPLIQPLILKSKDKVTGLRARVSGRLIGVYNFHLAIFIIAVIITNKGATGFDGDS